MLKRACLFAIVVTLSVAFASAQEPNLKIPVTPTQADNGKEMYVNYCAPCHGLDGHGKGPRSAALKIESADLTQLSKNNKGVYPEMHVVAVLKFGTQSTTHGSKTMPVWGPALQKVDHAAGGTPTTQTLRIANIVKYIETLQEK